jgi:hypothetical protein
MRGSVPSGRDSLFDTLEPIVMVTLGDVDNAIVYGVLKPLETAILGNIVPREIAE